MDEDGGCRDVRADVKSVEVIALDFVSWWLAPRPLLPAGLCSSFVLKCLSPVASFS